MESENSIGRAVKVCDSEKAKKIRRRTGRIAAHEIRDRRTFQFFLRAQGYLHGAFIRKSKGRLVFLDWSPERFRRKTRGDYSAKTIERQFPRFQRWCEEYQFQRVNLRGRWVVRVTPNLGVRIAVPGATIRERLEAAIRAHVAKAGRTKVDRVFCRKFAELSALPLVAVETVCQRLTKLDGLKCRWRGEGHGLKFCVERPERWAEVLAERAKQKSENLQGRDPQTSVRSAFLRNERFKNSRRAADGPEETEPSSSARTNEQGSEENRQRETRSEPEPGGLDHPPGRAPDARSPSGLEPLQICGRFVSARKLRRLASWLAVARLKFAHVNRDRVAWRFAHARNFAVRALVFGYGAEAIAAAYAAGVARSHGDALDADRLPGGGYASQREPSAAVVYGWQALRADARTPAELWAAFFAAPRRGRDSRADGAARRAAEKRAAEAPGSPRVPAAEAAARLAELRATIGRGGVDDAPAVALGELAEFLRENGGMTLAEYRAQPAPWRGWIVGEAKKWLALRAHKKKTRPQLPGEKWLDS